MYLAPPPTAGGGSHEHGGHRKTLRYVEFDGTGQASGDRELDSDVCSCCQTAVVTTPGGPLVAYRDHLPEEIRDISFLRRVNGKWNQPTLLHADGWKINGCPTEGPSMASRVHHVGAAWATRASGEAKIQFVLSSDAGAHFSAPVRVDDGNPIGRPAVATFGDDFLVTWLEKSTQGAEVRLRRISHNRSAKSMAVAKVAASRSTGFPKVAVTKDTVLLAWRDERVRSVKLDSGTIA